jgi:hypothetical protein
MVKIYTLNLRPAVISESHYKGTKKPPNLQADERLFSGINTFYLSAQNAHFVQSDYSDYSYYSDYSDYSDNPPYSETSAP